MDFISSMQNVLAKQVSKEITQKRHDMLFDENQVTPRDCWAVLEKARDDFVATMDQLVDSSSSSLTDHQRNFAVYYLEAIVILKHLQRPCVVQNMKVSVLY